MEGSVLTTEARKLLYASVQEVLVSKTVSDAVSSRIASEITEVFDLKMQRYFEQTMLEQQLAVVRSVIAELH